MKGNSHFLDDYKEKYDTISADCKSCDELKLKKKRYDNEADNREKTLPRIRDDRVRENTKREIDDKRKRSKDIDGVISRHCRDK